MRKCAGLVAVVLGTFCGAAAAAVYKCDDRGKVVYSDTPCVNGKQSEVKAVPALGADADAQQAAQDRSAETIKRADKAVDDARRRTDADAKRRAEIAVAERRAEEARLRKEAAEAEQAALLKRKAIRPKLVKPKKPTTSTSRTRDDNSGTSMSAR